MKRCRGALARDLALERVVGAADPAEAGGSGGAGGGGCASYLSFSPDGERLAIATADCRAQIYRATDGRRVSAVEGHRELVTCLCWRHAERDSFYTSSLDRTIRLWRGAEQLTVYRDHNDWIRCMALSGDDQHLVSGCVSSKVVGWDPATGQVKFSLQANQSRGSGPASPVARLCNTNFDNSVNSLAFGSTGPHRFVSGIRAGTVRFWDARCLAAGASFTLQAHDWKLNKVELGQNDTMLLTSGRDGALRMWDSRYLTSNDAHQRKMLLWEAKSHACASYNVSCAFFNGDQSVATGSEDDCIWLYDAATGAPFKTLRGHSGVVHFVATPPGDSKGKLVLPPLQ